MPVHPVSDADKARWVEMMHAYAAFYKTTVTDAGLDQVWSWIHDPENDFWCDVLEKDGQLIGFTQYQLMHRSLSGEMVCYLSDLFVEPTVRGNGNGRALIDAVFDFAKARRISNVRWLTQDYNYAGRRLYDTYTPKSDFVFYSKNVDT